MKKDKKQSAWFKAQPTVETANAKKSNPAVVRSLVLMLILLTVISTLRATGIFPSKGTSALPINFNTVIFAFAFGIGFAFLYEIKRFKTLVICGVILLFFVAAFFLRADLYYGAIKLLTNFLSLYNHFFSTNFIAYIDTFSTSIDYTKALNGILLMLCCLLSLIFGALLKTQRALIPFIILSLPLLWLAVNFADKPLALPIFMIFFAIVSILALESAPRSLHKIQTAFREKHGYGKNLRIYNGGAVSSSVASRNLVSAVALSAILVAMVVVIFPQSGYKKPPRVEKISADPVSFFQEIDEKLKLSELFANVTSFNFSIGGGMSGGNISQIDRSGFRYETHLKVAPSYQVPMLLKGYVGSFYDGNEVSWGDFPDEVYEENAKTFENLRELEIYPQALTDRYTELLPEANESWKESSKKQYREYYKKENGVEFKGEFGREFDHDFIIQAPTGIENVKADTRYLYLPYAATGVTNFPNDSLFYKDTIAKGSSIVREPYQANALMFLYNIDGVMTYMSLQEYDDYKTVFGSGGNGYDHTDGTLIENGEAKRAAVEAYDEFVYQNYLQMPEGKYQRLKDDMKGKKLLNSSTVEEIPFMIGQIKSYLKEHAVYDLSPGKLPKGKDYIEYFLYENHRGYCTNFATAGTMLFRAAGIPARYVEGYTVTEYDYTFRSSSDGRVEIMDSNAHAWVEIYMKGTGWVPVDVTPGFSGEAIATPTTEPDMRRFVSSAQSSSEPSSEPSSEEVSSEVSSNTPTSSIPQTDGDNAQNGASQKQALSGTALVILTTAGMILLVIAIIFIKYRLALYIKARRFSQKNKNKAAISIYRHMEEILAFKGFEKKQSESELEFASRVQAECPYIRGGEMTAFTEIAMKATFSNHSIDEAELETQLECIKATSQEVYKGLKPIEKLRYKLIDNLK